MGRFQEGRDGTGLSPHIKQCRPIHVAMARSYILGSFSPTELAKIYGYTPGQISRIIGSPAFQAECARLDRQSELVELDMAKSIKAMSERALEVLDEDLEIEPESGDLRRIRQNAALEVLDIAGIRRKRAGGTNIFLQNNDNRQIHVGELSEEELRKEIIDLTQGPSNE